MTIGLTPQIESILAAGNQAPSGENCQPWRFVVRGNSVEIHIDTEKDRSFYNWGQRSSYTACGAALENMVLAASAVNFRSTVTYEVVPGETCVAKIELTENPSSGKDPLEEYIFLRSTNRKKYAPIKLTDKEKDTLKEAAESAGDVILHMADSKENMQRLSLVGSANEQIMLSNQALHSFFFSHINWTKEEDDQKRSGFFLKTLELPPPAAASFYLIRNWSLMKLLNAVKFEKMVSTQNAAIYASSAAFGALVLKNDEALEFVKAGRSIQRMWLTATKLGLYIQPLTGIFFFKLKIDGGEGDVFLNDQRLQINSEYAAAQKVFDCEGKRVAFMFRIGSGEAPSAHSTRRELSEVTQIV